MKIHLQSLNYELWNIVEPTYTKPTTNYSTWNEEQKKSANLDAKAMNALFCTLNKKNSIACQQPDLQIKYGRFYK